MVFKAFDTMLLGAVIRIHTDHHKNLTYTTSVNDRVLRQLNHIERFGPTYQHIAGKNNFLANMFSQCNQLDEETTSFLKKRESTVKHFSFILDDDELLECFLILPDEDDIPFALDLE
jgi:hypothetical protein